MNNVLFLVGPTAVGKSALAVAVAEKCGAEIVNADAFQIYRGLDLLTGKPEPSLLRRVPHHLLGTVELEREMSAGEFGRMARAALDRIRGNGKVALIVGGSGFYLRALIEPFSEAPPPNPQLRREVASLTRSEAVDRLRTLAPERAARTDLKNPRRVSRALEIAMSSVPRAEGRMGGESGESPSLRGSPSSWHAGEPPGVLLVRDRNDLYRRINQRVHAMFDHGVTEEIRLAGETGATSQRALGYELIRQLIAGEITEGRCVEAIQQATRRYSRRQLTWFRRQTSFAELNLTTVPHEQAVDTISRMLRATEE